VSHALQCTSLNPTARALHGSDEPILGPCRSEALQLLSILIPSMGHSRTVSAFLFLAIAMQVHVASASDTKPPSPYPTAFWLLPLPTSSHGGTGHGVPILWLGSRHHCWPSRWWLPCCAVQQVHVHHGQSLPRRGTIPILSISPAMPPGCVRSWAERSCYFILS
jgi:hypothetical protein